MAKLQKTRVEFGDFQTPSGLARQVARYLRESGEEPRLVIEPTCGVGRFLAAAGEVFPKLDRLVGIDINGNHVRRSREDLAGISAKLELREQSVFDVDWKQLFTSAGGPILVLGNPPWVTASELAGLGSSNLPVKSNFQNRSGLDAITGKANFDIAEHVLIKLAEALEPVGGSLAMLIKTSVARRFLEHCWKSGIAISKARMLVFDAAEHFKVSADACLLHCRFATGNQCVTCDVAALDDPPRVRHVIGWEDGCLSADAVAFAETRDLARNCAIPSRLRWRSGVKHDCATVMELTRIGTKLLNGEEEEVGIEDSCLYPLLKGSAVARGRVSDIDRILIVPQRYVGQETLLLKESAPQTWNYLTSHGASLDRRGSTIYRQQPRFAVFGVGDYTFRPFKVAISALYKKLEFRLVRPIGGRPVVFDDTVYFLSFDSEAAAKLVHRMLNSSIARRFYESRIFWDNKRPITTEILGKLDLVRIAQRLGMEEELTAEFKGGAAKILEPSLFRW